MSHQDCLPPRAGILDFQGASVSAQGFVGEQSVSQQAGLPRGPRPGQLGIKSMAAVGAPGGEWAGEGCASLEPCFTNSRSLAIYVCALEQTNDFLSASVSVFAEQRS